MIAHNGCFEDESAVMDMCPPCSVFCAVCFSLEDDHLFSGHSVLWDQSDTAFIVSHSIVFSLRQIAIMHWSEPKSYSKPFELLHSQDFGLRGQ